MAKAAKAYVLEQAAQGTEAGREGAALVELIVGRRAQIGDDLRFSNTMEGQGDGKTAEANDSRT